MMTIKEDEVQLICLCWWSVSNLNLCITLVNECVFHRTTVCSLRTPDRRTPTTMGSGISVMRTQTETASKTWRWDRPSVSECSSCFLKCGHVISCPLSLRTTADWSPTKTSRTQTATRSETPAITVPLSPTATRKTLTTTDRETPATRTSTETVTYTRVLCLCECVHFPAVLKLMDVWIRVQESPTFWITVRRFRTRCRRTETETELETPVTAVLNSVTPCRYSQCVNY